MSDEPQLLAAKTREQQSWWMALAYYLLGAAIASALLFVVEHPVVRFTGVRLCWRLGPWPNFPLPYDRSQWLASEWPTSDEILPLFAITVLFQFLAITALHGFTFLIVVGCHTWFGWPPYWSEARSLIDLGKIWAESARRSWWIWPAALAVWTVWSFIEQGSSHAGFHLVNTAWPFFLANLAVVVLGFARRFTSLLRSHVVAVVGPDVRRCFGCGYSLRGLSELRCPECGRREAPGSSPTFGLRANRGRWRWRGRKFFIAVLIPIVLFAPGWAPRVSALFPST